MTTFENRILKYDHAPTNRISALPNARSGGDDPFTSIDIPPSAHISKFGIYRMESPGEVLLTKLNELRLDGKMGEASKRFALALPVLGVETVGTMMSLVGTLALVVARHPVVCGGTSLIAGLKGLQEGGFQGLAVGACAGPAACVAALSSCVFGSALIYGANRAYHYMRYLRGETKLPWAHAFEETPLKNQYNFDPGMQQSANFLQSMAEKVRSLRVYLPF